MSSFLLSNKHGDDDNYSDDNDESIPKENSDNVKWCKANGNRICNSVTFCKESIPFAHLENYNGVTVESLPGAEITEHEKLYGEWVAMYAQLSGK